MVKNGPFSINLCLCSWITYLIGLMQDYLENSIMTLNVSIKNHMIYNTKAIGTFPDFFQSTFLDSLAR